MKWLFAEWAGWTRNSSQISAADLRLHSLNSCGKTSALEEDKNLKKGVFQLKTDSLSGIICLPQLKPMVKEQNLDLDAMFLGFC